MDWKTVEIEIRASPTNRLCMNLKLFIARWFTVLSEKEAIEHQLKPLENVYGDRINSLNCRSMWVDKKGRVYRVAELSSQLQDKEYFN